MSAYCDRAGKAQNEVRFMFGTSLEMETGAQSGLEAPVGGVRALSCVESVMSTWRRSHLLSANLSLSSGCTQQSDGRKLLATDTVADVSLPPPSPRPPH